MSVGTAARGLVIEVQVDAAVAIGATNAHPVGVLADDIAGEHGHPLLAIAQLLRRGRRFWQLNNSDIIGLGKSRDHQE
jgi:hypothetical protein